MRIGLTLLVTTLAGGAFLPATAQTNSASPFKDDKEKASYAIGMSIGTNLKRGHFDVDFDVMLQAMKDTVDGRELKLNEQQAREILTTYQQSMIRQATEKNHQLGEAFLAENKKKEGVKIHPVSLPDGTTAELQYKVITEGAGAMPHANDMVTVNYRGTLVDGTEFDSSAKQGHPVPFVVSRVIRGWTEALQLMKAGSKWQLFIPASLAYGDRPRPGIEPGSTLIFDVELVSVEPTPPPPATGGGPSAQPALNSDIVRVPSAEELKAGAKVEIIKQQDLEKERQKAINAGAPK